MFITVNGVQLYYETAGHGTPLLLLHGNGEDHTIFDKIIEPLSARYQVFALDSRDHGKSEKTREITYQQMAEDTVAFCRALALKNPVLFGFSDGGIIGLIAAYQHPQLLSRLVAAGANITPDGLQLWFRLLCKIGYLFSRKPKTKMMLTQPHITKTDLSKIKTPTLLLAGQHDLIRQKQTMEMAEAIPNGELKILKGEGHISYVAHSRKLLAYL